MKNAIYCGGIFVIVAAVVLSCGVDSGISNNVEKDISDKVTSGAVRQYDMVAAHGSLTEQYVQAQLCAVTFLQSNNESAYVYWRHVQDSLGQRLHIPKRYR